jgi:superfamily I DNA/RNA helicase
MNIKLPEYKKLTEEQQEILNEKGAVSISGGAGTGKSILSIWKHILNWEERGIKSFLITYTHSLTRYFELSIQDKNSEASKHIENKDRFKYSENIDMLIIDEAQDISINTHKKFENNYQSVSYGADDKQILYPNEKSTEEELKKIYKTKEFVLTQIFRNSYEILNFVKYVFPSSEITEEMMIYSKEHFETKDKPLLVYSSVQDKLNLYLLEIIRNDNSKRVAILVPTVKMFNEYKDFLSSSKISFSSYDNEDKGSIRHKEIKNIHLTIFKSSKGLEFDIVIIPNIEDINYWRNKPKNSTININDYYVGMTRAREELILLSTKRDLFDIDSSLYEIEDI